MPMRRGALAGALVTARYLAGGLLLALLLGLGVDAIPLPVPVLVKHGAAALLALGVVTAVGAGWGKALAGLAGSQATHRMRVAGALGFGPMVIAAGAGLGAAEPALVARGSELGAPIHTVFAVVFSVVIFGVASVSGAAVGLGLRDRGLALRLGLGAGTAAALAFLLTALGMDAAGWRVGAPDAARRATMLTATAVGIAAAALAGGAAIGRSLSIHRAAKGGTADAAVA